MNATKSRSLIDATTSPKVAHSKDVSKDEGEHVLHDIDEDTTMVKKTNTIILFAYIFLIILGIATGFILSGKGGQALSVINQKSTINTGKAVGSSDTSTFKDSAVGVIQKGGLDGEGTHQLVRDGGPSQTAYLVSSVVDLDQFVGRKVKVWGQTLAAKKASWLLDVGKVEVQ